ncbi:hypothetical protein A2W13_03360 [Candidatus Woesebacteria bacterium RBG_16_36_11]|uniref:Uncharacterized protein n=3 Tax=Candidatus Woeseibacteriota TaxID=1752722 RepID=A0A1F7XBT6_9BACT|nr:MAG: hypothetical protein A2Z67_00440 [Candidatus Woesebacteria bacterium RBG_13_36_22]OGM12494.1 MAG: hypothetical protein A2W13_03360 [Candidatus Woesebacteria bacterium RBG_16_36_11]OGM17375.1 MAG: hypothetical protein A2V55_00215 [Candidatus Woesebacteria bacterium RBG_19FT_COMBO_37_29]
MLETPHVVVGAAIAFKVGNPALALPLALGSHFILEKIPHWNPHLNTEKKNHGKITSQTTAIVVADSLLSLLLGTLIAFQAYPDLTKVAIVLLGAFLAALPDLIEAPYFFLNQKSAFIFKWIKFKKSLQANAEMFPGLVYQFLTVVAAFWWVFG